MAWRTATVSAVVPAYDAGPFIDECLSSITAQRGDFTLEVIVVDDGSGDDTAMRARRHGATVIRQSNRGPAAARNAGVAAAAGEFVAFLDADDLWPADKLARQLDVLARHPDAALVFGDCRQFDAAGPRPQTQFESAGLGIAAWGTGETLPDAHARLLEDNFITTGSVIARRATLLDAGGFAEDLRLVEDLELWLRLSRRRAIAWTDALCLLRRRHGGNTSADAEAMAVAYLEVLRRAAATGDVPARTFSRLAAREHLHLSQLTLAHGNVGGALGHAGRSMALRPSLRAGWAIARAAASVLSRPAVKAPRR